MQAGTALAGAWAGFFIKNHLNELWIAVENV